MTGVDALCWTLAAAVLIALAAAAYNSWEEVQKRKPAPPLPPPPAPWRPRAGFPIRYQVTNPAKLRGEGRDFVTILDMPRLGGTDKRLALLIFDSGSTWLETEETWAGRIKTFKLIEVL